MSPFLFLAAWSKLSFLLFQRINPNDPYCGIYNEITSTVSTNKLKGSDHAYVDYVAVDVKSKKHLQKVSTQLQKFDLSITLFFLTK